MQKTNLAIALTIWIRLGEILPASTASTPSLYTAVLPQTSLRSLYAPVALYKHQVV